MDRKDDVKQSTDGGADLVENAMLDNGETELTAEDGDWNKSEEAIGFVKDYLADEHIEILFDGSMQKQTPLRQQDGFDDIETRLKRAAFDEESLLDDLTLNADRFKYPLKRSEAKIALRRVLRDAREQRRIELAKPLFEPLTESDEQAALIEWQRLAGVFEDELGALCITVLQQFVWQVKCKLVHQDVQHHLMPIITSSVQGSGKTTFVDNFLAPLQDLVAPSVLLSDLADSRSADVFRFPVGFVDDVECLDRKMVEALKSVMTSPRLHRRRLGSSASTTITQATTLIGTANRSVDELIADETGNRRFAMLPFRNGAVAKGGDEAVWSIINDMDAALLWRSIDPDQASPIEACLPQLHAWQEQSRPKGEVENWLAGLDLESQSFQAILVNGLVMAKPLYELFKSQTESSRSNTYFGIEMTRLSSMKRGPFAPKIIKASGSFYPIKES